MPELLLELFSEEIPARMQGGAARDLARLFGERLSSAGLTPQDLRTFAGPRRLTLVCELPARTPDRSEEVKGPKASAPAQALDGFLRKTGLAREQLVERDGVLFAVLDRPGRATPEIVAEAVEAVVRGFPWPKSMRWADGTLRWVRPLKRILCLFDGAVVPFALDGIEAGDATEGHRFMGTGRPLKIRDFSDYRRQLEASGVVLDAGERKARILERSRALCAEAGLGLVEDEGLLEEVAGLAEWPVPILGDMEAGFLDLPPEVIRTSMRVHQKYFAVVPETRRNTPGIGLGNSGTLGGHSRLAPHFLAVANIEPSDGGAAVAAGNARVLSARLNDARFFWNEDRREGAIDAWLEKLKGVTFHAKLGTLAERVDRIAALAREIAPLVGADPDQAERAARLAKADLASGMVAEFPELQGVMGGYYVRALPTSSFDKLRMRSGESDADAQTSPHPEPVEGRGRTPEAIRDAVADAVRDHYRPQGPADAVPTAPVTVAVALADKLDTLVGFFAIDEKPTGSRDPYALRRAALGVIRLIDACAKPVSLRSLIEAAVEIGLRQRELPIISVLAALPDESFSQARELLDTYGFPYIRSLKATTGITSGLSIKLEDFGYASFRRATANRVFREYQIFERQRVVVDKEELLLAFFADRLKVLLREQGQRHDLVDAVFALGDDDLVRIVARVEALGAFLATEDGANLLAGQRRAANILKAEAKKHSDETYDGPLEASLMTAPEEAELSAALTAAELDLTARLHAEDFVGAMGVLASLRGPVDAFFDRVLVNDPDPAVRLNRLRLLNRVQTEMARVADFSQIVG